MRKILCAHHLRKQLSEILFEKFTKVEFFDMQYKKSKYHLSDKVCEVQDCDQDATWICHLDVIQ